MQAPGQHVQHSGAGHERENRRGAQEDHQLGGVRPGRAVPKYPAPPYWFLVADPAL
jgi:hypothetical protein